MPSTRSTSSSDGERKPNTRSKGGVGGGGAGTRAASLKCTKPSPRGRSLTKPLTRTGGQGGKDSSKVSKSTVTSSKIDQGQPVEKGKRGRKPKTRETSPSSPQDEGKEPDNDTISDSPKKVGTTDGSTCDPKTSASETSNCGNPSTDDNRLQSTNIPNGKEEISAEETSDDTKHINKNVTSSVSSDNSVDSVMQKAESVSFEMIPSDEMLTNMTIPTVNEFELLVEPCDDDAKSNSITKTLDNNDSISVADKRLNEIPNGSNVSDNSSSGLELSPTKLDVSKSNSNTAVSPNGKKTVLEECDKTALSSSKSPKSNPAVMSEASVRKSGRRSVPNRKYVDMETDFSRKKSKTASTPEKKSVKSPEPAKASKSQNISASTLKRKLDLDTETTPVNKKMAVNELSENVIEKVKEKEDESPKKLVQSLPKTISLKRKVILSPSTSVSPATGLFKNELTSSASVQKIAPPILKIASTQKSPTTTTLTPTPVTPKVVQPLPAVQQVKNVDPVVNKPNAAKQVEPVILFEAKKLAVSIPANRYMGYAPDKSTLSEELSESLTPVQSANEVVEASPKQSQPLHNNSKSPENSSKPLPDSLNSSVNSASNNKPEQVIVVHPTTTVVQQENQKTDCRVAENKLCKDSSEAPASVTATPVSPIMMTLPNTVSSVTLPNSSLPNTPKVPSEVPMTYSVDMAMSSPTKPIISFTEGISQTSPYTVSLLSSNTTNNSSSKDEEAVESLINATQIAEKVDEGDSVMMCLSSETEDLVPTSMTLNVNTPNDAHRLETEAAIQEITATFPPTFSSSDIGIAEKDPITKTSISLAEAAKMVAESQTIVDLQDVNISDLEGLRGQSTPIVREAPATMAVASTQTPLQLRRKNPKSSSLMKSLTGSNDENDVDDEDVDDDDEDDDLEDDFDDNRLEVKQPEPQPARKGTQEFIVVHLPEGVEIKRERVDSRNQLESLGRGRIDENGSYRCQDCNYVTEKKANWYKHRKKHLGLRPHSCVKCNYKATTSSNLKRHMAIHADLREYKCCLCSNYFRQKIHLERHMKYKHEEKKVQCPLCNYVCASENPDLKIHFKRRHVPNTYGTMNSFTCDECGLVTVSKKDLKQHAKFHRRGPELKLFCEQCSFVTDCESRLRRHVFTHTKVKPFKCGLCDYRGSQKEHVLRHMKSRHSIEIQRNPRRIKEEECLESLERDRTDYTSRDKIFACNHCSMKFSKLINLYKHLHTQHKTIMPSNSEQNVFYCVVCDFKTTSHKNLLVHMRKHNMQEQNPPSHVYSCVLCRYVNPKRRNLFQHMMKKHGIEIVMNMKEEGSGSSNGYTTTNNTPLLLDKGDGTEPNIMTVGNVVTTTSEESNQLMVVTEDADVNTMQTVITIEDLASSMTNPVKMSEVSSGINGDASVKELTDELQQQHAADAVEGLQALADLPRVVDHDDVEVKLEEVINDEREVGINNEVDIIAEKGMSELDEATVSVIDQLATQEAEEGDEQGGEAPVKESFELTTDQVVHLSTGDYVEINGEVYKVEISTEPAEAEETVTTTAGASESANPELFENVQTETNVSTSSFLT